jgi:CRP-like cAMP-binding protein
MTVMNIAQTIQRTALFQGVQPGMVEELAEHCHQKNHTKGKQLFEVGDKAESFFVILSGWVKLFRISREGEEAVIHIFGPGESFAEAAVFRDQRTYPVNAQAVTDVEIVEIPRSFFIQKIENDSQFAMRILASISSRQHYLVGQLEQVTTRTAPQRIGAFLLRFCQRKNTKNGDVIVDLPYDKSLISTRLNIKPETFSRALAKLEPYGVILDGREILLHDVKKLAEFCDVSLADTPC